jgi:hypothetical protein
MSMLLPAAYKEDVELLLDCFNGGDIGSFIRLCSFLQQAEREHVEVTPVRHLAKLLRKLKELETKARKP